MAQAGFSPIILFHSTTATNAPTTANLAVGELALNIPDGRLYYTDGTTVPSINGPSGAGWGKQLWTGPITNYVALNDAYFQARTQKSDYIAVQIAGYLYSPVATTATFQTVSDDGVVVYFNNTAVISNWTYHGAATDTSATLTVNAGYNPIRILYFEGSVTAQLNFVYRVPATGAYTGNLKCNFFYNYNQM